MLNHKFSLLIVIAFLVGGLNWSTPRRVQAANIIVDGTSCTLPDAIIAANTDAATGGCIAGSGADTITLDANFSTATPDATSSYIDGGQSALPDITSVITIQAGDGNTITRTNGNVAPYFRILNVTSAGNLTLNGITVTGGYLLQPLGGDNAFGGGIRAIGALSVTNSTVSYNTIVTDSEDSFSPFGGGIYASGVSPTTINNSTISYNSITGGFASGGGMFLEQGTITNSIISHNEGSGLFFTFGAGIAGDHLTISQSVVASNKLTALPGGSDLPQGAGIVAFETLVVAQSRIENNQIVAEMADGIAIFAPTNSALITDSLIQGNFAGDLIYSSALTVSNLTLVNSTVSGNLTAGDGIAFAVYVGGSGANHIQNSTIVDNNNTIGIYSESGALTIQSSIVSDCYAEETFTSQGYNLVQDGSGDCVFNGTGDQVNVDPLLAPLANNGGFSQTHALLDGSPAIDAGTCAGGTITTDQRGVSRPFDDPGFPNADDGCDIGAFERNTLSPTLTPSDTPSNTPTNTAPLSVNIACNTNKLEITVLIGDALFDITGTGNDLPQNNVPLQTTIILQPGIPTHPGVWQNVTVTEQSGDQESINYGDFFCVLPTMTLPPSDTPTHTPTATATCAINATAPNLISPEHRTHTTDRTPTFTWSAVNNAKSYRLMVYTEDRSFEYKKRTFNTSYTLTNAEALTPAKYLWRVRTQDNTCDTWTGWSRRNTLFVD